MLQTEFIRPDGWNASARSTAFKILALQILDDRELELHPVGILRRADNDRHSRRSPRASMRETSFARDQFILDKDSLAGPLDLFARDGKRLQERRIVGSILRSDCERGLVEITARLERVRA